MERLDVSPIAAPYLPNRGDLDIDTAAEVENMLHSATLVKRGEMTVDEFLDIAFVGYQGRASSPAYSRFVARAIAERDNDPRKEALDEILDLIRHVAPSPF